MERLSSLNAHLLCEGAKIEGNFTDGYQHAEENISIYDAGELLGFSKWIDKEVGGASSYNIQTLFKCYKNPNRVSSQTYVSALKTKIKKLNWMIKNF